MMIRVLEQSVIWYAVLYLQLTPRDFLQSHPLQQQKSKMELEKKVNNHVKLTVEFQCFTLIFKENFQGVVEL